ncbi:hypothetical protein ROHU_001712 [Labeo rohita]|uniref:Uncharacterized protein n=1 Tax=Labeo rohita TaxID=84645 RepID=A0A498P0U5_LABRO|nr:hypothetical protein ROHU_001712 [Labeo rohita]
MGRFQQREAVGSAGEHITKTINCLGSRPTLTGRDTPTIPANIQPITMLSPRTRERRQLERCHGPGPRDQQLILLLTSHMHLQHINI